MHVESLIEKFTAVAQETKHTFTIYVDINSPTGHAFVSVSDGTQAGTNFSGFYGHPGFPSLLLWGWNAEASIENDAWRNCTHTSEITWNITKEQYDRLLSLIAGMKQEVEEGTLKYNLYSKKGMLSCISYATTLAESIGLEVPEYIKGGRLPPFLDVPDPKALDNSLWELWKKGGQWDNATIWMHDPTGVVPKNIGSASKVIDTSEETPGKLGELFNISIEQQYLPPKSGRTGQQLNYKNPISSIDPNCSFVFWDFGDVYTGVVGSPFDPSYDYEIYHCFDKAGTYNGALLIITNTTLHHFTFTTEITGGIIDGFGGIVVPVDKFGLLAPYIGLASTIVVTAVGTVVYVKRVKHKKEKQ